jgi:signal transduction histidine kinase
MSSPAGHVSTSSLAEIAASTAPHSRHDAKSATGTMTGLPSIQRRLSYFLVGVSLAWGLTISGTIWVVGRSQVDRMLDYTLLEAAEILYGLLSFDVELLPMQGALAMPTPYVHDEHLIWQVISADGHVVLQSHRAPAEPISRKPRLRYFDVTVGVENWRVFGMPLREAGKTLYVGHFGVDRQDENLDAIQAAAAVVLLSGLACAFWLRSRVRKELAPLNELSGSVAEYDPLQRNARLVPPSRQELVSLREAVIDFGSRLAKRVANERAFTAHAAHALRTPLAGMDAQLAAALLECAPEQQSRLQRTRDAATRLHSVVTALLTLFRSGVDLQVQQFDVGDLVLRLPLEALQIHIESSTPIVADKNLLAAAMLNLFDNSIRHGATAVRVNVVRDSGVVHIRLQDNGPGMPAEQLRRIQDALDRQEYEGHMGLGLMLADLIARAHRGRLNIANASPGVTTEISLPDAPDAR